MQVIDLLEGNSIIIIDDIFILVSHSVTCSTSVLVRLLITQNLLLENLQKGISGPF